MNVAISPTPKLIEVACEKFDQENALVEQSLEELFRQYPNNLELSHVFLKVVAVNFLYSTQIRAYTATIPNVEDVARHIFASASFLDSDISFGKPEVVDLIADLTVTDKKHRSYFSFASKYCSWHNPDAYPIYDARVLNYLCALQKQTHFSPDFKLKGEQWKYADFVSTIHDFRRHYGLEDFSFKAIDKFLWLHGDAALPPIADIFLPSSLSSDS